MWRLTTQVNSPIFMRAIMGVARSFLSARTVSKFVVLGADYQDEVLATTGLVTLTKLAELAELAAGRGGDGDAHDGGSSGRKTGVLQVRSEACLPSNHGCCKCVCARRHQLLHHWGTGWRSQFDRGPSGCGNEWQGSVEVVGVSFRPSSCCASTRKPCQQLISRSGAASCIRVAGSQGEPRHQVPSQSGRGKRYGASAAEPAGCGWL